ADSVGHLLHTVAFVEVRAAGHHGHVEFTEFADDELAGVPHGGRVRPAGNLGVRDVRTVRKFVGERAQSAAEHEADGGTHVGAALDHSFGVAGGLVGHSSIPAMQADMKLAMVPAATARKPSRARSLLRVGARAPMPPI